MTSFTKILSIGLILAMIIVPSTFAGHCHHTGKIIGTAIAVGVVSALTYNEPPPPPPPAVIHCPPPPPPHYYRPMPPPPPPPPHIIPHHRPPRHWQ